MVSYDEHKSELIRLCSTTKASFGSEQPLWKTTFEGRKKGIDRWRVLRYFKYPEISVPILKPNFICNS